MANEIIKGYKGFDKDLKCRGFQYEIGKTHEMDESVELCERGFHAVPAENSPLDVFGYYSPAGEDGIPNRFCEVEASGIIKKSNDKIAAPKLKVVAEIGIVGIVKAHVEWVLSRVNKDNKKSSHKDEDNTIATNTGNKSAAEVPGKESVAIVTGKESKARGALGCWLVLTERGEWDGEIYPIIEVRAVKVDGDAVKPNVWYELSGGKVVEA